MERVGAGGAIAQLGRMGERCKLAPEALQFVQLLSSKPYGKFDQFFVNIL